MGRPSIYNKKEMTSKRLKARYLIVVEGYTVPEAAKAIDVHYKAVLRWCNKYHWKEAKNNAVEASGGFHLYFGYFLNYVRSAEPSIYNQVKDLWFAYVDKQEKLYHPEKEVYEES